VAPAPACRPSPRPSRSLIPGSRPPGPDLQRWRLTLADRRLHMPPRRLTRSSRSSS
jgi:hypothetical protein